MKTFTLLLAATLLATPAGARTIMVAPGAGAQAALQTALIEAQPEEHFQFERHGYFVADRVDSKAGAPVFNRAVTLRDSWAKK